MSGYQFDYSLYQKRIHKKSHLSISLMLVAIIILTGIACFIGKPSNSVDFYFLEVDNFLKYSDASECASALQNINAGGYVYFDGRYHVLACAYLNKEDATTVKDNISTDYPNAKILTLSSTEFYGNNFSSSESDAIQNVIDANQYVIEKLYSNVIKFDSNNINLTQLELNLKEISKTYSSGIEDFNTIFKTNSNMMLAKELIVDISNSICKATTTQNVSQQLKYYLIKIAISSYSFLEFFS